MPSLLQKVSELSDNPPLLTQAELKRILLYDPETGIFTWRINICNIISGSKAGSIAGNGYLDLQIKGITYRVHRLVFLYITGKFPKYEVDHINRKRLDNRWKNLRDVTRSVNHRNRNKSVLNTSGTTGVSWDKKNKKWMAHIKIKGVMKNLGRFTNKQEAILIRKRAEVEHNFVSNHGKKVLSNANN